MSDLLTQLPLAVGTVRCGGEHHQLVWRDGRLHTPAHSDPEAERALAALGGETCRCVELLGYWDACATDAQALTLGPRERVLSHQERPPLPMRRPRRISPGSPLNRSGSAITSASGSSASISSRSVRATFGTSSSQVDPPREDPLSALLRISDGLSRRLLATVAATLIERHDARDRAVLQSALYGRVLAGLTRWLGERPGLDLKVVGPDAPRSLSSNGEGYRAELPLVWLTEVWAPDLTHAEGQFTLRATPVPPGRWTISSVDRELTTQTRTYPLV